MFESLKESFGDHVNHYSNVWLALLTVIALASRNSSYVITCPTYQLLSSLLVDSCEQNLLIIVL